MSVSPKLFTRLPMYLHYLKQMPEGVENISATAIAAALGYGDVQVRKDLSAVSGEGKPKTGYEVCGLIHALENFLGYNQVNTAVIVGAGKLGMALYEYTGFAEYGLRIAAAFDKDPAKVGVAPSGKLVYPLSDFEDFCSDGAVKIGIITTPAVAAQQACDLMCANGIEAIWCFAPAHINAREGVMVQYENMASSLALLSSHLARENE